MLGACGHALRIVFGCLRLAAPGCSRPVRQLEEIHDAAMGMVDGALDLERAVML